MEEKSCIFCFDKVVLKGGVLKMYKIAKVFCWGVVDGAYDKLCKRGGHNG